MGNVVLFEQCGDPVAEVRVRGGDRRVFRSQRDPDRQRRPARMVKAGAIDPAEARRVLTDAGRAAEQTDRDIHAAITGGFHAEGVAA